MEQRFQMNKTVMQLREVGRYDDATDLLSLMENDTANYIQRLYDLCPSKVNVGAFYFPFVYHLICDKLHLNTSSNIASIDLNDEYN